MTSRCSAFLFRRWIKRASMGHSLFHNKGNMRRAAVSSYGNAYCSYGFETSEHTNRLWYGSKNNWLRFVENGGKFTNQKYKPYFFTVSKLPKYKKKNFFRDKFQSSIFNIFSCRGYTAPEYLHNGKMSVKSDVYSLGIIIIELVTGHRSIPDNDINNVSEFYIVYDAFLQI
jgi:serine/threonine protein kinase